MPTRDRRLFLVFAILLILPLSVFAQTSSKSFWDGFFDYQGPILSMVQASVGEYASVMLTKVISEALSGESQMQIDQPLLIGFSLGMGTSMVMLGKLGNYLGWSPAIYYPITMVIPMSAPPFLFHMDWKEYGIYVVIVLAESILSHVIFSAFLGYNNYMPFIPISPIWKW